MTSINTPSVDLVERPSTTPVTSTDQPQFRVRFSVDKGRYVPVVIGDTTGGTVRLVDSLHATIECSPQVRQPRPFAYQLIFEVPFLVADPPIRWTSSTDRPVWITKPVVSGVGSTISMVVTDAADLLPEAASFLIEPRPVGDVGPPPPIDPTIVSNPPN